MKNTSIKKVKLRDLKGFEKNVREMGISEFEKLKRSISKYGYINLLLVDENNVVLSGNHRLKALLELYGPEKEVDVVVIEGLTEKEKVEISLALNRIQGNDNISKMVELAKKFEIDIDLVGISQKLIESVREKILTGVNIFYDVDFPFKDISELEEIVRELKNSNISWKGVLKVEDVSEVEYQFLLKIQKKKVKKKYKVNYV